jgi:hypothetical protein
LKFRFQLDGALTDVTRLDFDTSQVVFFIAPAL